MNDFLKVIVTRRQHGVIEEVSLLRLQRVDVESEAVGALVDRLDVRPDPPEVDVGISSIVFGLGEVMPPSQSRRPVHLGEGGAPRDVGLRHVFAVVFPDFVAVSLEIFVAECHVAPVELV